MGFYWHTVINIRHGRRTSQSFSGKPVGSPGVARRRHGVRRRTFSGGPGDGGNPRRSAALVLVRGLGMATFSPPVRGAPRVRTRRQGGDDRNGEPGSGIRRHRRNCGDAAGGHRDPLERSFRPPALPAVSYLRRVQIRSRGLAERAAGTRVRGGGRPGGRSVRGARVPGDRMAGRMISAAAKRLGSLLADSGRSLSVAESCTGGLVAGAITSIPGSSRYFRGGVVAYHNSVKTSLLHVPPDLIAGHGAVSREVALAMAEGVLSRFRADLAIAVTGVAGPGGGSRGKPVGTVWVAVVARGGVRHAHRFRFHGGREAVRREAVRASVDGAIAVLQAEPREGG